ncbi:tyrosine-protein phosphatase [Aliikangiella coralliicola]|uniref:Tyrosine-protein phosphatase n=1 Tax=Aliikangiella coralliicola TaxID=2592383 RepID=A0A545UJF4_9GAMM|nr:tyrosine-protein phosphatase [Aliikangiella coralliicola]TQV89596.1 tyrosine-protein phosphatase [Aliikangiella coralliicola]
MIPNLRDVGEVVNIIYGEEVMNEGVLFRGGTVNQLFDQSELPNIQTIINLRTGPDKQFSKIRQVHIPAVDQIENYTTSNGHVRNWTNRVIQSIIAPDMFPLLIHCTAGKDRTGVIVALILLAIGINRKTIIEEYCLNDGVNSSKNIEKAIEGIGDPEQYIYEADAISQLKIQLLISEKRLPIKL